MSDTHTRDTTPAPRRHADPRVPPREACVVRYLIERWAAERGEQVYAVFDAGREWTYAELRRRVVALAAGLQRAGVRQGDHVLAWQPNTPEMLVTFYAINWLGAVYVPINTAYRGSVLDHVIENSDARLAVVHADLLPRLKTAKLARLETVVVVGAGPWEGPALTLQSFAELAASEGEPEPPARPIEPWDTQSIIYTSGTTGPSKGVLSSYLHMYTNPGPEAWHFVTGEDRFLVNMPMFHIGGMGLSFAMLVRGGSVVASCGSAECGEEPR